MFLINKDSNRIEKISQKTFGELGFRERENLQEWLANNADALGEELLIIQKEFSGFNDTNERLDLLALDKQGNLVIIENKLDDSGRNVAWQCLKYASYCSSLKKSQIIKIYQEYLIKCHTELKAEDQISEFMDGLEIEEIILNAGNTQRIILVSGSFRKEVTSTVIWLLNYGLRIQCFQATPYALEEQLFLSIDQIIPTKESEEFTISMAEKNQENLASQSELKNRHIIRKKFWSQVLTKMNEKSRLFENISPGKYNWIGTSSGVAGISYNFAATRSYIKAELYIDVGNKETNESIFDKLFSIRDDIEQDFGQPLGWERIDLKRACRVKFQINEFDIFDETFWEVGIEKVTDGMVKLEKTIGKHLREVVNGLS